MEEDKKRRAYSEVVEILKLIDDEEKIEKIPFEVIEMIKNNSDFTYKPEITSEKPLEEQNISEEAFAIMGWIASRYWGVNVLENDEKEIKEEIHEETKEEIKEEHIPKNAAVFNDIERETLEIADNIEKGENLPILVTELSWYKKIASKIMQILKRLFKFGHKQQTERGTE